LPATKAQVKHPIGVFDSGLGGLSILQALRAELPHEDFVYIADSGNAPYGEREDGFVVERSFAIARYLTSPNPLPVKALVVACNTATAAAIHLLRRDFPALPIIGVEPALKPALAVSQTRRIGVLATRSTLNSQKFKTLLASVDNQAEFICQPCDGLANAIEQNQLSKIIALCADYTRAIGQFGTNPGEIDTLVLGCTHYPFASQHLQTLLGTEVQLISNGEPVARHTRRMLQSLAPPSAGAVITLLTTGKGTPLQQAAKRWLNLDCLAQPLLIDNRAP
jgi:glutamate racemase